MKCGEESRGRWRLKGVKEHRLKTKQGVVDSTDKNMYNIFMERGRHIYLNFPAKYIKCISQTNFTEKNSPTENVHDIEY